MRISDYITVLVFISGVVIGASSNLGKYLFIDDMLNAALLTLMFSIGLFFIGRWKELLEGLRDPHVTILVFATLLGGLLSGLVGWILLNINLRESIAISIASGWYSFVGAYITAYDPVGGIIGFIGNLLREAFTLAFYPIISRFNPLIGVPLGGATTMDTSLGVIARYGGGKVAGLAFIHGLAITLIVPIIVPLIYP